MQDSGKIIQDEVKQNGGRKSQTLWKKNGGVYFGCPGYFDAYRRMDGKPGGGNRGQVPYACRF